MFPALTGEYSSGLRLVGGNTTEGILQVTVENITGTVCSYNWDDTASEVACREMFGSRWVNHGEMSVV